MADAVSTKIIFSGKRQVAVHITNLSDGTGESGVVKIDKSTLTAPFGVEPTSIVVDKIQYSVNGMAVVLAWDHDTDVTIAVLAGYGKMNWECCGSLQDTGTGGTGDIILTTNGHTSGDSYDITLHCHVKE